ncbi:MAG: hypothetical protein KAI50_04170 [Desulfobacterales bacterium]|nr:hypothetical protein [Desulfobacterales bacterium]
MAKVYLSFLGTNDYLACTYYTGDREVNNVMICSGSNTLTILPKLDI